MGVSTIHTDYDDTHYRNPCVRLLRQANACQCGKPKDNCKWRIGSTTHVYIFLVKLVVASNWLYRITSVEILDHSPCFIPEFNHIKSRCNFSHGTYIGPCLQQGKHRKTTVQTPDLPCAMVGYPKNHVGPVASSSESSEKCFVSTKSLRGWGLFGGRKWSWTAGQLPSCGVQNGKTNHDSDMRIKLHKSRVQELYWEQIFKLTNLDGASCLQMSRNTSCGSVQWLLGSCLDVWGSDVKTIQLLRRRRRRWFKLRYPKIR